MSSEYHHGDLPASLRSATVELIAERGPGGFSLREVARRAGVSHAAPAHHFGDTRGLLTSVAAEGYRKLAQEMSESVVGAVDARDRLLRCGRAYLQAALANPGHYGVMVGHDHTDHNDPELLESSIAAYVQLQATIEALRDEYNPELDVDATATICWATAHGIVEIASVLDHVAESTGTNATNVDGLLERFTDIVIDGITA